LNKHEPGVESPKTELGRALLRPLPQTSLKPPRVLTEALEAVAERSNPAKPESWATPVDRAIAIADRVAQGGSLSEEDSAFLWTDPELVKTYSMRLNLELTAAAGGAK